MRTRTKVISAIAIGGGLIAAGPANAIFIEPVLKATPGTEEFGAVAAGTTTPSQAVTVTTVPGITSTMGTPTSVSQRLRGQRGLLCIQLDPPVG